MSAQASPSRDSRWFAAYQFIVDMDGRLRTRDEDFRSHLELDSLKAVPLDDLLGVADDLLSLARVENIAKPLDTECFEAFSSPPPDGGAVAPFPLGAVRSARSETSAIVAEVFFDVDAESNTGPALVPGALPLTRHTVYTADGRIDIQATWGSELD